MAVPGVAEARATLVDEEREAMARREDRQKAGSLR